MGINFTNQIVKFTIQESVVELKIIILTTGNCANKWGKLKYGWIGLKYCLVRLIELYNQVNAFFDSLQKFLLLVFSFLCTTSREPSVLL